MKLFLDSVNLDEIRQATDLGIISGLTTTPTFMHRHGITDTDGAIVQLSGMVAELHVEALGEDWETTVAEAHRIMKLPLKSKPVFKIPISRHGLKACRILVNEGCAVNVHLIYTLNQVYMALEAGASYVCPLVGRLQDEGHDAMTMIAQAVELVDHFGYNTKIMVSSVRHPEHVRQALLAKAHACTVPWGVLNRLTENALTTVGTEQFVAHTKLMSLKVRDLIRAYNPVCELSDSVLTALVKMTESGLGVVSIVDGGGSLVGIFTDGDLRRNLHEQGDSILSATMAAIVAGKKQPVTISVDALLYQAVELFREHHFDNIIAVEADRPVGILDIQDLTAAGLLG